MTPGQGRRLQGNGDGSQVLFHDPDLEAWKWGEVGEGERGFSPLGRRERTSRHSLQEDLALNLWSSETEEAELRLPPKLQALCHEGVGTRGL